MQTFTHVPQGWRDVAVRFAVWGLVFGAGWLLMAASFTRAPRETLRQPEWRRTTIGWVDMNGIPARGTSVAPEPWRVPHPLVPSAAFVLTAVLVAYVPRRER